MLLGLDRPVNRWRGALAKSPGLVRGLDQGNANSFNGVGTKYGGHNIQLMT